MFADRGAWRTVGGVVVAMVAAVPALCLGQGAPSPEISPYTHAVHFGDVPAAGGEGGGSSGGGVGLPSNYSLLPNYVTSVKDQVSCGSCWAFAIYGSMESNILMGGGDPAVDLSENHFKNYHGFAIAPCEGGNQWIGMAYLSRLDGPVAEADDPYHAYDDRPSPGGPRQYFLSGASIYDTADEIKTAVMGQGALYTYMCYDGSSYNATEYTYRYVGANSPNHAVAIVGWDDSKAVAGAGGSGAWLAKNSWGTGWGDSGYFWVSYEDTKACKVGVSFQAAPPGTVQNVYYHDRYGNFAALNRPYAMNVFEAVRKEELKSVGFYTQVDGASYDIRIYDTLVNNAPSGLLAEKTGTMDFQGFHVVDLDSLVSLDVGDDFIVYLHLTNGGDYPQALDYADSDWCPDATSTAGEGYYSLDGTSWTDLYELEQTASFSIKVYTVPEPGAASVLGLGAAVLLLRRRRRAQRSP